MINFMIKIFFVILFGISGYLAYYKGYLNKLLYRNTAGLSEQIKTIRPVRKDIVKKKVFSGRILPRKQYKVCTSLGGNVQKLFVKLGSSVRPNDPIAKIVKRSDADDLETMRSRIRLLSIEVDSLKKKHARIDHLFQKKMCSKEEFEESLSLLNSKQEELSYATSRLQHAKVGYTDNEGIDSSVVKAGVAGTIIELPVDEGSILAKGACIASIGDMRHFVFNTQVEEWDVVDLRPNMMFNVKLAALKNHPLKVKLTNIAPVANPKSNKFSLEGTVVISERDRVKIRGGYSAPAEMIVSQALNALSIPEYLVENEGDKYFVWCLNDSEREKRYVKLGLSDGLHVEILEGLTDEDVLVVKDA